MLNVGSGARDGDRLVLTGGLAAGADRPDDLAGHDQRDAADQGPGAVQREAAQPPAVHLLLDLAAGAHEDRGGARLVDRDLVAGGLRVLGAAQPEQPSGRVDHRDDDAVALLERRVLGGGQHGLDAGGVQDPAGSDRGHGGHAPLVLSTAAQMAVSAVMNRTSPVAPPKVKFTAPGRSICPSRCPSGVKTWTPEKDET